MKGLLVTAMLIASSLGCVTTADAHEGHHKGRPYTTFKVLRPVDVIRGVGCYCKEATEKAVDGVGTVLKGTGDIIKAPFKTHLRLPQMRHYRWYRGHWHEVKPTPRGVRSQDLKAPEIDLGVPADDIQFIPVPFEPEVKDTIVFFERKF
tara:strand:- start:14 stop:460 length:447 start_codon:yes stop_codon:yes gene_type:complete